MPFYKEIQRLSLYIHQDNTISPDLRKLKNHKNRFWEIQSTTNNVYKRGFLQKE